MVDSIKALTFYAVDVASPFDLALHSDTNSLDKITQYPLFKLKL